MLKGIIIEAYVKIESLFCVEKKSTLYSFKNSVGLFCQMRTVGWCKNMLQV